MGLHVALLGNSHFISSTFIVVVAKLVTVQAIQAEGEVQVWFHWFLTSPLDGGEWLAAGS